MGLILLLHEHEKSSRRWNKVAAHNLMSLVFKVEGKDRGIFNSNTFRYLVEVVAFGVLVLKLTGVTTSYNFSIRRI